MIDIEEYKKEERRRYQKSLIGGNIESYNDKPHNIIQSIKQGFQKQKENIRFKKEETQSKRFEQAKRTKEITEQKDFIQSVNAKAREQRFAPIKAFAQGIKQRTAKRSGNPVRLGGSPGGNTGSIFTAQSNSPNNIYFKGSGNNPYNFTGKSPVYQKRKGKRITINL